MPSIKKIPSWRNQYNGKYNRLLEANDGIAFAMTTDENTKKSKGKKKKLHVTNANRRGTTQMNVLRKKISQKRGHISIKRAQVFS